MMTMPISLFRKCSVSIGLIAYQVSAYAATSESQAAAQSLTHSVANTAITSPTMSLFKMFAGLLVVIFVMMLLAWFFKRLGLVNNSQASVAKVISSISVGSRERVVVLEIAGRWIVVGVASGRVNAIATLDNVPTTTSQTTAADAQIANTLLNPMMNAPWMVAAQKFLNPNKQSASAAQNKTDKPNG